MRVLRSSGHPELDREAARTLSRWRFRPARRDLGGGGEGRAVGSWVRQEVIFRLCGGSA